MQAGCLQHFVFLDAQDLAECVHLPAHVLHHVVDGVHLDIAALIAVEGELDRHTFGGFHQQRCIVAVGRFLRSLRGQTFEQLREIDFGALPSSTFRFSGEAFGSCMAWPKWVSRRIVWITSSSCRGTTPPVHAPPAADPPVTTPAGIGMEGTLPNGAPPSPPEPPELAP